MDCILLTCDNKLKKEAEHQNIEAHGSIWIIDQLIDKNLLDIERAIGTLELLKEINAWLPVKEIDVRIESLRNLLLNK